MKLNILQITLHGVHEWMLNPSLPETGGQNVFVNELARGYHLHGHDCTIATRGGYRHPITGKILEGSSVFHGMRILYLNDGSSSFLNKHEIRKRAPELAHDLVNRFAEKPDVIISHHFDGGLVGMFAALKYGVPHVWVPHTIVPSAPGSYWPAVNDLSDEDHARLTAELAVSGAATMIVSVSRKMRKEVRERYWPKLAMTLTPGINPLVHSPDLGVRRGIQLIGHFAGCEGREYLNKRRLVLELSRTHECKRKDVALTAFARIAPAFRDAVLMIAIDENQRAEHRRLMRVVEALKAADEHLEDQLLICPNVPIFLAPELMRLCDVFLAASERESFGLMVQEALACGTVVVGTDVIPAMSEGLAKLATSRRIAVPVGDVTAMGSAIAHYLRFLNGDIRHTHRRHSLRNVGKFSWGLQARRILYRLRRGGNDGLV